MTSDLPNAKVDWLLVIILALLVAIGPLAIDMYLPALPMMTSDLVTTAGAAQMTISAFLFAFAFGQLLYGPISDSLGRRPVLISGIVVYLIASFLCAIAPTIDQLIFYRFIQALGGGACAVLARTIVRDRYQGNEAVMIMSFIMSVMALAPMVAPVIGGYVLAWSGWREIFYVLCFIAIATILLVVFKLPESHPKEKRVRFGLIDYLKNVGIIFKHSTTVGYILSGGFTFAAMFAYVAGTPFVYIELFGISETGYGYYFAANALGMMFLTIINARLVKRFGFYRVELWVSVFMVAALLLSLVALVMPDYAFWLVIISMFFFICCVGPISTNAMVGALEGFGERAGLVSSFAGFSRFFFGGVAGSVLSLTSGDNPMTAMIIIIFVSALASLLSFYFLCKKDAH